MYRRRSGEILPAEALGFLSFEVCSPEGVDCAFSEVGLIVVGPNNGFTIDACNRIELSVALGVLPGTKGEDDVNEGILVPDPNVAPDPNEKAPPPELLETLKEDPKEGISEPAPKVDRTRQYQSTIRCQGGSWKLE